MNNKEQKNILLTAFRNSSAESMIKKTKNYNTLFLPNDKIKDFEMLKNTISNGKYDYVISFGQRPMIKNKVYIEDTAHEGDFMIHTNFNCDVLEKIFLQEGIITKISHNAGTSYCNKLYLNGLKYIFQNDLDIKMVFVHIPYKKNITNFDKFCEKIFDVISYI
ncbi:MAG: hypothetical protein UFG06_14230 [Lachnospiraceae bacterium]|nr:hypothetical protein [Lachnospiraceae bacterium]